MFEEVLTRCLETAGTGFSDRIDATNMEKQKESETEPVGIRGGEYGAKHVRWSPAQTGASFLASSPLEQAI